MGFEVSPKNGEWTADLICDRCYEVITEECGETKIYWTWDKDDDQKYSSASFVSLHEMCAEKDGISDLVGTEKVCSMNITEYISIILLKFPIHPGFGLRKTKNH